MQLPIYHASLDHNIIAAGPKALLPAPAPAAPSSPTGRGCLNDMTRDNATQRSCGCMKMRRVYITTLMIGASRSGVPQFRTPLWRAYTTRAYEANSV